MTERLLSHSREWDEYDDLTNETYSEGGLMISRPKLSVVPSGGLFSRLHLTSQRRQTLSPDERRNFNSTILPRRNWSSMPLFRTVACIPCSETSPINTGRLIPPDTYSAIKLTLLLGQILFSISEVAIRLTILISKKEKTEHTKGLSFGCSAILY